MDNQFQKSVEALKTKLRTQGINPDPYTTVLIKFQELLNGLRSHHEIEVASKVVMAMGIAVDTKHVKFHQDGGHDEKQNADHN